MGLWPRQKRLGGCAVPHHLEIPLLDSLFYPSPWSSHFICHGPPSHFQIRKREKIKRQIAKTYEEDILGGRPPPAAASLDFGFPAAVGAGAPGVRDDGGLHSSPSVVLMGADGGSVAMEVDAAALEAAAAAAGLMLPLFDVDGTGGAMPFPPDLAGPGPPQSVAAAAHSSRGKGGITPISSSAPAAAALAGSTGRRASRASAVAANAARAAALDIEADLDEAEGGVRASSSSGHYVSPRARSAAAIAAQKAEAKQAEEAKLRPTSGLRKIVLKMPQQQKPSDPGPGPAEFQASSSDAAVHDQIGGYRAGPSNLQQDHPPSGGALGTGRRKSAATPLVRLRAVAGGSGTPAATPPSSDVEGRTRALSSRVRKQRVIPDSAEMAMGDDDDLGEGPSGADGHLDDDEGGLAAGYRKRKGVGAAVPPSTNKRQRPGGAGGGDGSRVLLLSFLQNPLVLLTKAFEGMSGATAANQSRRSSAGGGRPSGITGVPISSVVCLQDGVMTSGIDGAVRFHMLSSDRLA